MTTPTPDTGHLSRPEFSEVYDPAEDSFLLMDALEADRASLQVQAPTICWEIGYGSRPATRGSATHHITEQTDGRANFEPAEPLEAAPASLRPFSARSYDRGGRVRVLAGC